jgi:hypothetical protein
LEGSEVGSTGNTVELEERTQKARLNTEAKGERQRIPRDNTGSPSTSDDSLTHPLSTHLRHGQCSLRCLFFPSGNPQEDRRVGSGFIFVDHRIWMRSESLFDVSTFLVPWRFRCQHFSGAIVSALFWCHCVSTFLMPESFLASARAKAFLVASLFWYHCVSGTRSLWQRTISKTLNLASCAI